MPCEVIRLPGGATAIVRRPKQRPRRCSVCKMKVHNFVLCDFVERAAYSELPAGVLLHAWNPTTSELTHPAKTCDVALCRSCAVHVEPDTDYCPLHAAALGVGGRKLKL